MVQHFVNIQLFSTCSGPLFFASDEWSLVRGETKKNLSVDLFASLSADTYCWADGRLTGPGRKRLFLIACFQDGKPQQYFAKITILEGVNESSMTLLLSLLDDSMNLDTKK